MNAEAIEELTQLSAVFPLPADRAHDTASECWCFFRNRAASTFAAIMHSSIKPMRIVARLFDKRRNTTIRAEMHFQFGRIEVQARHALRALP